MKNVNQYTGWFVGLLLLSATASAQVAPDTRPPGRIRNSVVDGRDYNSIDYVVGGFVGYKFGFGKKTVRPYLNVEPLGFLYVASQSKPHPIVGQTSERPFYAGTVQFGIDF